MIKSPLGVILVAAAAVLALSPEARKGARKLAVRGTGALLDLADQIKDAGAGLKSAKTAEIQQKDKEQLT